MPDLTDIFSRQKAYLKTGYSLGFDFRVYELKKLKNAVKTYESRLLEALELDLGKSEFEAYETEIGIVYSEIDYALDHVHAWMKPRKKRTPISLFPAKSTVYPMPKGVVLIMSPWNYPVLLTLSPLIAAMSAGNCAVVKPSRYSENVSRVLCEMIGKFFKDKYIACVEGGRDVNTELLKIPFDHIFFTGSKKVGKVVMKAAADLLTPVTLELGGKSPCIVDDSFDADLAAKRIIWGKCVNAGQTCVAPDYLIIHSSKKAEFLKAAEKYISEFFGENPLSSRDLGHIINLKHFERLTGLMDGEKVLLGGRYDRGSLKIEPTLIDADEGSKFMDDEIFGPVLPVISYDSPDQIYTLIAEHPNPLALYLFTMRRSTEKEFISFINFGGGCINDTVMHLANENIPFGGIRDSGIGSYHGKAGFDTFTHYRSVVRRGKTDVKVKYPPYGDKVSILRKIMK